MILLYLVTFILFFHPLLVDHFILRQRKPIINPVRTPITCTASPLLLHRPPLPIRDVEKAPECNDR